MCPCCVKGKNEGSFPPKPRHLFSHPQGGLMDIHDGEPFVKS